MRPSSALRQVSPDCYFLFPFLVINHSHFVVLSRCQLGGFYQRTLDVFIALLRERHTHRLVGRAFLIEPKRETSPISSAHVSAVIGPTPGTVLSLLIRSANTGSR